ncbi:RhoGAP-domain-containing protein [Dothidotthia symphoricarpi CBS 119687]|uniref:RhoGAP-domain-containing protein n=1 Tax=Dothidotthia symphoricarpi CBS 119687 TaxID=1392245 RepID=A0A6A6A6M7_9PLEO|nr:RhoGAP-domain-containing protein [Dothidotthia symphoricarpi CBS 119687]KAF2127642.1 RhoGAP-domain-containing protein [Dothidotthia symphoricarpi CBS 119687]
MESPTYPESPLDQDDVVYPCKGCGEILEEGKAFELAGNRWHIDCFRCNTCGTLLDSDANLLLLGDGSLICNNCTYSCNHCGNKIEDLAILTGDQAFCANCFRCRNCKRKIENLRYARTSQGIFCMACHESLMARRRKKSKKPPAPAAPKVDKSLPALPGQDQPQQRTTFTPDVETPSEIYSEPPTTNTSPRLPQPRRGDTSSSYRRDASPAASDLTRRDNLTLPATTYSKTNTHVETPDAADDGIMLPFALDPNPAPGPSPLSRSSRHFGDRPVTLTQSIGNDRRSGRDYFNRPTAEHREKLKENNTRPASTERRPPSPHIAYQEKGRQQSENLVETLKKRKDAAAEASSGTERSRSQHASPVPSQVSDPFKLQDVPQNKKTEVKRRNSESITPPQSSHQPQQHAPTTDMSARLSRPLMEPMTFTSSPPTGTQDSPDTSGSSFSSTQRVERPARGDSLNPSSQKPPARGDKSMLSPTSTILERTSPAAAATANLNAGLGISSPLESLSSKSYSDTPVPPARSAGRPAPPTTDTYTSPRAPPHPPAAQSSKNVDTASSINSEGSRDVFPPGVLPRYSAQGDFSMDEDFARLLGGQENKDDKDNGVFRRVSNAVSKHGRSFSDRGSVNSRGHKKWPTNGSVDISSPTVASPDSKEESVNLRNELRRAQQKIAELEAAKNGLEESLNSAADIRQANTVLREKRNTMAVLDTQREMIIRELEIMTDHLKRTKEGNSSMDINQLKSDVVKDFATSLQKLKDQLGNQIEELITKRAELTDEISNLIQMKDKGFQEYETLTAQNTKMAAMYRDLVDNIQKTYQTNKKSAPNFDPPANGLGIYNVQHKGGKSELSVDAHGITHDHSFSNLHEADSEATLAQPQVVNIRKPGKANKFSTWKKGGQAIKTNVTKGFKGAFGSESTKPDEYNSIKVIGTPYGSVHTQPDLASMSSSVRSREDQQAQKGWFGAGKPGPPGRQYPPNDRFRTAMQNNSSTNVAADASTVLFGSDLSARCEFEKQMIPRIVSRCIEEVELRGMDVEGVYRKSGGTSQVNQVRSGFESDNEHDISDPDLDIHAVTSAMKNYFRRLPVPLITFDVYDQFLEAGLLEDNDAQIKALIAAVNEIPKAHRDTLQFLVFHLSRVIQRASDNLMTPLNLAVVFAPTIMRPMDIQRELTDVSQQRIAVQALLENYKTVFGED